MEGGGGDGGGGVGGGGEGGEQSGAIFVVPAKKKLRPTAPPVTPRTTSKEAVFSKRKDTAYFFCNSVAVMGSDGLLEAEPNVVDLNAPSTYAT